MIQVPRPAHHGSLLLSAAARPVRFAGTGLTAGIVQLTLLTLLVAHGWNAVAANAVAFLLAAQVNFCLSLVFTWGDRRGAVSLVRCWLLFHASISVMAAVNMAVFASARLLVPALVASALGICAGAAGNYLVGDRLVFRGSTDAIDRNDSGCAA